MSRIRKPHHPPRHGTVSGYTIDGCRDECCRAAHRTYMNRYRIRRGTSGGIMIDAAIIHRHLDRCIAAGMSEWDITRAAGWKSRNTLATLRTAKKVRPETAQRVLAIVPMAGRGRSEAYTDGYYTAQRLKQLRDVHGSYAQVARLIGASKETPCDIVRNPQRRIRRSTALAVLSPWAQHLRSIEEDAA